MKKFIAINPSWNMGAFEPDISELTMSVHFEQLHKKYVKNLNDLQTKKYPNLSSFPASDALRNPSFYLDSEDDKQYYINQMGGHFCHTLFWECLNPRGTSRTCSFFDRIGIQQKTLNSAIKEEGLKRFGSGWVWLSINSSGKLDISSTQNHLTPFMRLQTPILCVDLWEHAYFLDDFGDRGLWLDKILKYVDWSKVEKIYLDVKSNRSYPINKMLIEG